LYRFGLGPRADRCGHRGGPARRAACELDRSGAGRISVRIWRRVAPPHARHSRSRRHSAAARREERAVREAMRKVPALPVRRGRWRSAAERHDDETRGAAGASAPGRSRSQRAATDLSRRRPRRGIDTALGAEIGFAERLVWFWSNHFCVSAGQGQVRQICGAYEREAIRTMCSAASATSAGGGIAIPPCCSISDNARSIGPDSIAGIRQKRGLTRISNARFSSCIRWACARSIRRRT